MARHPEIDKLFSGIDTNPLEVERLKRLGKRQAAKEKLRNAQLANQPDPPKPPRPPLKPVSEP